ncbi:ABC-three component system protein [Chitinophaga sancti]|uniref:ABC-three component system protein n=1 Tax=Chitinophaga sancti TaxID=1004 RepID=UPI002A7594E3|nr:ABC-three component system protein [Chitinophaga sancti]WPQ66087.1 ABC-three component system protein [Chitinophaga sancti]
MAKQLLPHTAISTWSGFLYQGRVALYHVLKLLNEKNEPQLNELYVQIDSIEDFSIITYNDNAEVTPITIHQVKAIKSELYSTYKEDFKKLETKKIKLGNLNVNAFFHLAVKNEQTKDEIKARHPQIEIYCYEDNEEFCPLNEIDSKIRNQLTLALVKYNIIGHDNVRTIEILYDVLEKIVSDKVVHIHSLNHGGIKIGIAAYENPIPLSVFLNVIREDISANIQNESYFERKIRANLNRYYQEYCFESDSIGIEPSVKDKMDHYLYYFNALSSKEFKSFLQNIRPHKKIHFKNLQEYTDGSLHEDEIKDAFLVILSELKESNNNHGVGWKCDNKKNYFPTTITLSNNLQNKKRISERILNVALSNMIDVPFNSDYLVTTECNVESIQLLANKISDVSEPDSDKIINWKKLALIDLETAKIKLNG